MRFAFWDSNSPSARLCVLIVGGTGFAAGFLGPVIFAPGANQGPLVGILISGPGGAVLGLLLFAAFRLLSVSPARQWRTLWVCSAILAIVTLYLILPAPEFHGYIEDVHIDSCKRPIEAVDDAIRYWDQQIAPRPADARPGWQEDSRDMLQNDDGVVLTVTIVRSRKVAEKQKPWDKGRATAEEWQPVDTQKSYYARYAGSVCGNYGAGTRSVLFNDQYFYGYPTNLGWPPTKLANFLNLQTVEPVPEKYRKFIGD